MIKRVGNVGKNEELTRIYLKTLKKGGIFLPKKGKWAKPPEKRVGHTKREKL